MTDENTTGVVQNQQTSSIKSGDDFVLDFGEGENLQVIDDNNELKNDDMGEENNNVESTQNNENDLNLNQDNISDNSKEQENNSIDENNQINEDKDNSFGDDFSFSFDSDENHSEDNIVIESEKKEDNVVEIKDLDDIQSEFATLDEENEKMVTKIQEDKGTEENNNFETENEFGGEDLFDNKLVNDENQAVQDETEENRNDIIEMEEDKDTEENNNSEAENDFGSEDLFDNKLVNDENQTVHDGTENEESKNNVIEMEDDKDAEGNDNSEIKNEFNDGELFDNEEKTIEEEIDNNKMNDEIEENKDNNNDNMGQDFDFSFDIDSKPVDTNENEENNSEELEEINENNNNDLLEDGNAQGKENAEEKSLDEGFDVNMSDDLFNDESKDSEITSIEEKENKTEKVESNIESNEESEPIDSNEKDTFEDSDLFEGNLQENNESLVLDDDPLDKNSDTGENVSDFDLKLDEKETELKDKNIKADLQPEGADKVLEILGDNTENENKVEDKNDNNIGSDTTNTQQENLDFVMDYDPEETKESSEEQQIKQPEIGDLLGNEPVSFSSEESDNLKSVDLEDDSNKSENSGDINDNNGEIVDAANVDNNTASEISNEESSSESTMQIDLSPVSYEPTNQNMSTYDLSDNEEIKQENQNLEIATNNTEGQTLQQSQAQEVNDVSSAIETQKAGEIVDNNTNPVEVQEIKSTLSLDQILDSELNNNPRFADNSKAVPTNVPNKSWLFANKKMVGIMVGVFVLAGFVVALAFPSKNSDRKSGDTYEPQEYVDHTVAPEDPELLEDPTDILDTSSDVNQDINSKSPTGTITVIDFPDTDTSEEEQFEDQEGTIQPYIPDESIELEDPVVKEELNLNDIVPTVSSYKSQAKKYYDQGYELQDKQLIKYATQVMHQCDVYQEQLDNGEGLDKDSFEAFKSKVKPFISKMEERLGGPNEVEEITKANFDDENDFEGKDELRKYINDRANGLY